MKSNIKDPLKTLTTTLLAFGFLALPLRTQAVSPPPDGGYAGGNTAEGQNVLLSLTTGTYNTAIGFDSLLSLNTGTLCTGIGAGALLVNTGSQNTAIGAGALLSNTSGLSNTAVGTLALFTNATGDGNVATGIFALENNISGNDNTANGFAALQLCTASNNTGMGNFALGNLTSGASNIAVGDGAGLNQTTGSNNVYIGAGINGVAGESDACRIASIFGATITNGVQVLVNSDNRLGTMTSSKRFKQNITPTSGASEALYQLQPVTFQYKKEIDPESRLQFGLVAEDVEKVNPDLVVHDKEGKPYSVRYDQVNAMLLNEFLRAHHRIGQQEATITQLKEELASVATRLKEQESQIQKMSDQIAISKAVPVIAGQDP
jgi:hypothetical protein